MHWTMCRRSSSRSTKPCDTSDTDAAEAGGDPVADSRLPVPGLPPHASASSTMALAPPPPLQMEAVPYLAPLARSRLQSCPTTRAPDMPMGCPRATAPPWTFTVSGLRPRSFMLARATTANASFTSCSSMSEATRPARATAIGTALAGAVVNLTGACAASEKPRMAARGFAPRLRASAADMTTSAAAPSLSLELLAAVTVPPFLNAGLRPAIFSRFPAPGSSSADTVMVFPRPAGTSTGAM
mmetsp:Transcript_37237/g.105112  ORF Transcript_37237/g.105112 Transcript_37237/m.105112 type:complete len:241 (+) Transcript_37237:128-850(+)